MLNFKTIVCLFALCSFVVITSQFVLSAPDDSSELYQEVSLKFIVDIYSVKPGQLISAKNINQWHWTLDLNDRNSMKIAEMAYPVQSVYVTVTQDGVFTAENALINPPRAVRSSDILSKENSFMFDPDRMMRIRADPNTGMATVLFPKSLPNNTQLVFAPVLGFIYFDQSRVVISGLASVDADELKNSGELEIRFQAIFLQHYKNVGKVTMPPGLSLNGLSGRYLATGNVGGLIEIDSSGYFSADLPPVRDWVFSYRVQHPQSDLLNGGTMVGRGFPLENVIHEGIEIRLQLEPDPWLEVSYEVVDHLGNPFEGRLRNVLGEIWLLDETSPRIGSGIWNQTFSASGVLRLDSRSVLPVPAGYYQFGVYLGTHWLDIEILDGEPATVEAKELPDKESVAHYDQFYATKSQRIIIKISDPDETTRYKVRVKLPAPDLSEGEYRNN